MLLLAADTSGKHGSLALARGDGPQLQVLEMVPLVGGTFSAQLVPQIAALLGKHGLSRRDLQAFAVVSGPGSFTGLRVGLAAIKALAEILAKPIATVSLLEAVALAAGRQGRIIAALDASRGEVYVGEYEVEQDRARLIGERLLRQREFVGELQPHSRVVTPHEVVVEMIGSKCCEVIRIEPPRSDLIAGIGWGKILAGETVEPEQLEANYIRRSDAEIFFRK